MNEFVSWCRHLLVSFLFHALTSLHPPSFHRNDFSTCISYSITGLEEGSKYNITVSAGELSNTVSAVTNEKGYVVIMVLYLCVIFFPAPSTAPKVTLIFATYYSITLPWETVPCENRNGDITGYSVKYWERGIVNNKSETVMNIAGASVTEATISNFSTNYSIQIAAVNNAGTGVFSNAIITVEHGKFIKRFLRSIFKFTFFRYTSEFNEPTHSQQ